jgi:hypothetical protein
MNIRAKYPLPHAGAIIAAGATADLPNNLARMLIARGQAEDAAAAPLPTPGPVSPSLSRPSPAGGPEPPQKAKS